MLLIPHFAKPCTRCKTLKRFDRFSKNKNKRYGLQPQCKDCVKEYTIINKNELFEQKRKYRAINKEIIAKKQREYYLANSEKFLEYRQENKERIAKKDRAYRNANRDKLLEKAREYAKTDKGRLSHVNSAHRRRTLTRQGDVTNQQLVELEKSAKICYWCHSSLKNVKVHIDHYNPLSKGGLHTLSNLVVSCAKCNQLKSAKDPLHFAQSIGKLF